MLEDRRMPSRCVLSFNNLGKRRTAGKSVGDPYGRYDLDTQSVVLAASM